MSLVFTCIDRAPRLPAVSTTPLLRPVSVKTEEAQFLTVAAGPRMLVLLPQLSQLPRSMLSIGLIPGEGSGRSGRWPVAAQVLSSFSESELRKRSLRIQILNHISVSSRSIRFLIVVAIVASPFAAPLNRLRQKGFQLARRTIPALKCGVPSGPVPSHGAGRSLSSRRHWQLGGQAGRGGAD
jgi:hypothetical protein